MANYASFTTLRLTVPDQVALVAAIRTATGDVTAVIFYDVGSGWRGKKATVWSAADLTAAQNALDTTAALTLQLEARRIISGWPIWVRALLFVLLDQINLIRSKLPTPLIAITPVQAITAVGDKADTLS